MDVDLITAISFVVFILAVGFLFLKFVKKPSKEKEKQLRYKAIHSSLLSLMLVAYYFFLVTLFNLRESDAILDILFRVALASIGFIFAVKIFLGFWEEIIGFSWKNKKNYKKLAFWLVLLNLFVELLIAGSLINYVIYSLLPGTFTGMTTEEPYLIGFEFIHYTFTLVTTAGNSSINAVKPITQIMEMVELLVFYVSFGGALMNIISNATDSK